MENTTIEIYPPGWNGDFISLQIEDERGNGQTILHYGVDKTIILSEIVGITHDKWFNVNKNTAKWLSFHGLMMTDGKTIIRLEEFKEYHCK